MTKRLPKRVPNGTKNGPKSNTKINITYVGFQEPLGSVLGLSWVVWGSIWESKILKIQWFLQVFVKIMFFEEVKAWKGILDGTWVDFDTKEGTKRLPNRTQNEFKMGLKNDKEIRSLLDRS